jgi:hypothetical protein
VTRRWLTPPKVSIAAGGCCMPLLLLLLLLMLCCSVQLHLLLQRRC